MEETLHSHLYPLYPLRRGDRGEKIELGSTQITFLSYKVTNNASIGHFSSLRSLHFCDRKSTTSRSEFL